MLEADIAEKNDIASSQALTQTLPMLSGQRASSLCGKLVNRDRFLSHYWPHFSQSLTKKLGKFSFYINFDISPCTKTRRLYLMRSSVSRSLESVLVLHRWVIDMFPIQV